MIDQDLIRRLQTLKQVKPSRDWVFLAKNRILGQDQAGDLEGGLLNRAKQLLNPVKQLPVFEWRLGWLKPTLAFSTLALVVAFAVWTWGSLPGDRLYPAKKAVKQVNLLTDEDQAILNLRMAADSAQALKEIAKKNETDKLAPAIKEYEESVKRAVVSLAASTTKDGGRVLKIAEQVNQIEREAKEIEEILQTEIAKQEREELLEKTLAMLSGSVEELTSGYKAQLARQLEDLANTPLNEEQQGLFEMAVNQFKNGDYELAQDTINLIVELFNE